MSFVLSKILWPLLQPGNLVLTLLLMAGVLWWRGRERAARRLAVLASAGLLLMALLPLGVWLAGPLENRFPLPTEPPSQVHGIIVLGGPERGALSRARRQPQVRDGAERFIVAADLARRRPAAKLIFTGGSARLVGDKTAGATVAGPLFAQLGIAANRVQLESTSRNTWENAVNSRQRFQPTAEQTWILVTSALHMPRAVGCFRTAGWPGKLIPWPVDYLTWPDAPMRLTWDVVDGSKRTERAVRAWLGLVAYRLMGRTDALVPAP